MYMLLINLYLSIHTVQVKSAWVEIPQITEDNKSAQPTIKTKPAQFVFGAPKVSFFEQKPTIPTPPNHRIETTTPKLPPTTLANYKTIMTPTAIPPLTTTPKIENRNDPEPETKEKDDFSIDKNQTAGTYSGFLPLLQNIQQTLTLNAKKTLKSKISLLTDLRDNLLANIDERMSNLWRRNEEVAEGRGHDDEMDFPSNEGALMTIGFLTFAVFLIKLVLKLIHALKYKNNASMVMVTTMAPMTAAFLGRKKRELDALKILQFIEEYKLG